MSEEPKYQITDVTGPDDFAFAIKGGKYDGVVCRITNFRLMDDGIVELAYEVFRDDVTKEEMDPIVSETLISIMTDAIKWSKKDEDDPNQI